MTTTEIELVDGTKALMRAPEDVPEGRRGAVVDAAFSAGPVKEDLEGIQVLLNGGVKPENVPVPGPEVMQALRAIIGANICAFVKQWEYGAVTIEILHEEVPGRVYDQLRDLTLPLFPQIVPNFKADDAVIGEDALGRPVVDREGPTPPSVG